VTLSVFVSLSDGAVIDLEVGVVLADADDDVGDQLGFG